MNIDKQQVPTRLLWVDLEMTGLDPENDLIIEVAAEVTDFNFKTLASYESVVKQPHDKVVKQMAKGGWWRNFPDSRDDILSKLAGGKEPKVVEAELIKLLNEHFPHEPAVLAGNSIHNDRRFIAKSWPELDLRLHYRMLDVSSFKVLMQGKYGLKFEKKEIHRAADDIQASIAELQYYLEWFSENLNLMEEQAVGRYISKLKGVSLSYPYGDNLAVYSFKGEMFAIIEVGKAPLRISLECDKLLAKVLLDRYEEVMPGHKLNKSKWITVVLSGQLSKSDIEGLIDHSYLQVA